MFENYKKITKQEWAEKATKDLKGDDVFDKYQWDQGGLTIDPYYDRTDLEGINFTPYVNRLLTHDDPSAEPRAWKNIESIQITDLKSANAEALKALFMGADGVEFNFNGCLDEVSAEVLLNDIMADYCFLSFSNITYADALKLMHFLKLNFKPESLHGAIHLSEDENEHLAELVLHVESLPHFRFSEAVCEQNITYPEQVANLLEQANRHVRSLILHGIDNGTAVNMVSLTTCVGTDFFGEIAKIKALRQQYFQLARAYGATDFQPEHLMIKCKSPAWNKEAYAPHANMLKASTAAMAAIIGGCNILVVMPEKNDDSMQRRIARNVSTILKEESYLSKTNDPAAGAYYIESLTDQIAKKGWELFQNQLDR